MSYFTPIHPGFVLQDELEEIKVKQSELAAHIGIAPEIIAEICGGRRGIEPLIALKLSKAIGASPQFWMNLQNNWELSQIDRSAFEGLEKLAA